MLHVAAETARARSLQTYRHECTWGRWTKLRTQSPHAAMGTDLTSLLRLWTVTAILLSWQSC